MMVLRHVKRRRDGMQPLTLWALIACIAIAIVPLAAPFVHVGVTAATPSSSSNNNNKHHQHGGLLAPQPVAGIPSRQGQYSARQMAHAPVVGESSKRQSIGQFMKNLVLGKRRGDPERWKGGEQAASLGDRLLFRYASPLLGLAADRRLDVDDAFEMNERRNMHNMVPSLTETYEKVRAKSRRKIEEQKQLKRGKDTKASQTGLLLWSLLKHQRKLLLLTGVLRLTNTAVQAFPAVLLARLLRLVEAGSANPPSKAFGAALTLVGVLMVKMVLENQLFHYIIQCSSQLRGALSGLIFDKSLKLPGGGSSVTHKSSSSSKKNKDKKQITLGAGGVLNLMQSDASMIENAAMQLHTLWDGPLQIAIYTALLYQYLGPSVLYGIAVLLLTIPINAVTLRILNRMSKRELEAKDARTKRTAESIANMKLLKLQVWEENFAEDIRGHRHDELTRHSSRGVVRAINSAISNAVPALVLVVTLTAYAKTGRPIVASTIFTAISLFNQLRFPLFFYPMLLDSLANGRNSLRRISSYLASEEIVPYVEKLPPTSSGGGSIELTNGNFLWSTSKPPKDGEIAAPTVSALYDVNLKVNSGEIVSVIGATGSGKSALVKSLLGELVPVPKAVVQQSLSPTGILTGSSSASNPSLAVNSIIDKPSVIARGNIAYCSQEAWLPKGTIRDAVVFGREYDEQRYLTAIRDAGLDADINSSAKDATNPTSPSPNAVLRHETDVGEGGSALSGGQRARVALARALYSGDETKVFLLDDCLSALDASVGSTVFARLSERLRKSGAAAIFVTNDPSLPRQCDRVVLMQKVPNSASCSSVVDIGSYEDLIGRGHELKSISAEELEDLDDRVADRQEESEEDLEYENADKLYVEQNTIRVVGGYEIPLNCTTARDCHADPECHIVMEKCAEYTSDQFVRPTSEVAPEEDEEPIHQKQHGNDSSMATVAVEDAQVTSEKDKVDASTSTMESANQNSPTKKLVSADDAMAEGRVPWSAYVLYFKSVGKPLLVVAMLASYLISNGAQLFQQYTVAKWTELGRGNSIAAALGAKYLSSIVNAAAVVSVFLWCRSFLTMKAGVRASEFLHSRMLSSVFSAPMSFFSATPSGQLLSRFGKEMETVDRSLPDRVGSTLFCFLQIFMSAAALSGVVTPAMMVPLALVGSLYVKTMSRFRRGARDLKRAETKTRSPVYTHFGEALRGTEVIRSIPGSSAYWSATHRNLTDTNIRVFSSVKAFDRWLSCRLETLGNAVVLTTALASVYLTRLDRLKPGSAGWGLTQALAITGLMTWAVRCLADLETDMMSVVRVKELTDLDSTEMKLPKNNSTSSGKMPKEFSCPGEALAPLLSSTTKINATSLSPQNDALKGWPWSGQIDFRNISMRYNPISPLVLDGITLSIPAGTTLGVVGRTGSGKSSLLLTIFRLVEIEAGGSIEIDGVDIRSVSMRKLRESLSIIPQDPVLFAGSVAYNLDATGASTPEAMWEALQAASPSLAEQFRQSGGLDTPVSEGGKNFSLGQRQLICLARALLRKSKILVLDEATSSIDPQTDQEVQATIRREFVEKGVSVITVAHRLESVLGYDKIAVLGSGKVLEYGTPSDLLKIQNGELKRLVDADRLSKMKGAKTSRLAVPVP